MSAALRLRLAVALGLALLVSALGGFVLGMLDGGDAARVRAESSGDTAPARLRDPAVALRTLGANGHWGRYDAPSPGGAAPPAARAAVPDAEGVARDFRLVGIERRAEGATALLLPASAAEGSTDVIRLGVGEDLADGVSVSAIGADSVRFSTAAGSSTLHLYEPAP